MQLTLDRGHWASGSDFAPLYLRVERQIGHGDQSCDHLGGYTSVSKNVGKIGLHAAGGRRAVVDRYCDTGAVITFITSVCVIEVGHGDSS